jgi:hypothetical protein
MATMQQQMGSAKESAGSAIDLARTSIAPRAFNVGPPNYYTQTSFVKKLDVVANITVNDNLANGATSIQNSTGEKISTQTGVIVWLVNRGCSSIYRMGIVAAQSVANDANGSARGMYIFHWLGQGVVGAQTLTYNNALAVPYNSTNPADVIKISPDLGQQFSRTRLFAGDLRVICDTIPIGLTALNGVFSAGSFVDIRDIIQTLEGSNTANCFDPGDLVQQSVTSKDGIKEVSVMQGIVSLVGSDIPPNYTPPDQDPTDAPNSGFSSFLFGTTLNSTVVVGGSTYLNFAGGNGVVNNNNTNTMAALSTFYHFEGWCSPWGTTMVDTAFANVALNQGVAGSVTNLYNGQTALDLNINGVYDFRVQVGVAGWNTTVIAANSYPGAPAFPIEAGNPYLITNLTVIPGAGSASNTIASQILAGGPNTVRLSLVHMYVSCTSGNPTPNFAYACQYQTVIEEQALVIAPDQLATNNGAVSILCIESSPKMYIQNFTGGVTAAANAGIRSSTVQGMYLGTAITVRTTNYAGATNWPGAWVQIGTVNVQVRARNLYQDGEIGPVRVIRWDSLSDNQQIKVDGVLKVQCIPEGTLAPFVQNASMYSETAHNLNAITFLAELYNGESPIRRNWTGKAYDEFMRTVFPTLSPDLIVQWNSPKLEGIAMAGGFFRDLWDKVKTGAKAVARSVLPGLAERTAEGFVPGSGALAKRATSGILDLVGAKGQFRAGAQMAGSYKGKKRGRKPKRRAGSATGSARLSAKSLSALMGRHRSVSQAPTAVSKAGSRGKFSRRSRSHSSRASSATKRSKGRKGRKPRKMRAGAQMAAKFRRSKSRSHSGSRASKRSGKSKSSFRSKSSRARSMPRDSKGHFIKRR